MNIARVIPGKKAGTIIVVGAASGRVGDGAAVSLFRGADRVAGSRVHALAERTTDGLISLVIDMPDAMSSIDLVGCLITTKVLS